MSKLYLAPLLFSLSLWNTSGDKEGLIPLSGLLTSQEYARYESKPRYKNRVDQFKKAFHRYAEKLRSLTRLRRLDELQETLEEIAHLARHVMVEPSIETHPKDRTSKQVRKLEIEIRKLKQTVADAKFNFSVEASVVFDDCTEQLDRLRKFLLSGLFGDSFQRQSRTNPHWPAHALVESTSPEPPPQDERRGRRRVGDRFTDDETALLRSRQDLGKRVKVFLEIAESRLIEIERREKGLEWKPPKKKKKKNAAGLEPQNPLEFYTYEDMVHAYERAIDGITVNIDDQYRRGKVTEKDVKKTLKTLNEKVQEFLPRLEPLSRLAIEKQDRGLFRAVERAVKISEVALKGSQLGLGAPEK